MTTLPALPAPDFDAEITQLARDYRRANGPVMSLVNRLGGRIEGQMSSLPPKVRAEVERVTRAARGGF